jgi:regulator of sigma E protease
LVPLVIIHEFGHFMAAKLSGITVLEFGIGFPPRAKVLFRRGDTIYTLNWLPIGGFVRPYGEDFVKPKSPDEMSVDRAEIQERGIKNPKSVFFMVSGPGINFVAALILFIVIALVGQPYSRADVSVYDIQTGSAAEVAGLQQGDIIREFNGRAVESADEFNDWIAGQTNKPVTLLVERDGKQFETTLVGAANEGTTVERVYIDTVEKDMPAYAAGFLPEDLIIAVDDIEITSLKQLQDYTKAHKGVEIMITVLRGTQRLDLPVTPTKDSGGTVRIGIGIVAVEPAAVGLTAINRDETTYTRRLGPGKAIRTGVHEFVRVHQLMYDYLGDLIHGRIGLSSARPVSPVGIGQIGAPIFKQSLDEGDMYPMISFAALISVSLAITNLLPIPGLDGGRILFVLIELVRGKPMEPEREGLIHLIGVMLLLGIIFLAVISDIVNPINLTGK